MTIDDRSGVHAMTKSKLFRPLATVVAVLSVAVGAIAGPASANGSRDRDAGAAIALGIGAVVIGSILASKSRDRHREVYHEPPREPRFDQHRYRHPAPHVNHAPPKQYDPPNSGR
jgi:hypothetical protein